MLSQFRAVIFMVVSSTIYAEKLKYILLWSSPDNTPFSDVGFGQRAFQNKKCPFSNCFLTPDKDYWGGDLKKFDAVVFSPSVLSTKRVILPNQRFSHQKYVFASDAAAADHPACGDNDFHNFFNWTWTYKLNSDLKSCFIVIRDNKEQIIGPKEHMHWVSKKIMLPVSVDLKNALSMKTKAAAWFNSNCKLTPAKRFVELLQIELRSKHNLDLDIFGDCGSIKCDNKAECDSAIKRFYYFYLAFEDSLCDDYVTEKLIHAIRFNAIPIVFGGANYKRYLPTGSYLNARALGLTKLASKINELVKNSDKYLSYFKWKRYYTYHTPQESSETDAVCKFCEWLNNEKTVKKLRIYNNFRKWWNRHQDECYEKRRNDTTASSFIKHRPPSTRTYANTTKIRYSTKLVPAF